METLFFSAKCFWKTLVHFTMAKQSNLFNFFRGKNRQTFKNNNLSDSEVVSEVVNTLLASVEKQVSAEKENRKKKRTAANNVLDLVI